MFEFHEEADFGVDHFDQLLLLDEILLPYFLKPHYLDGLS